MKIHVLGDLHLEFGEYAPAQVEADVVVLAGDIHTRARAIPWIQNHYPAMPVVYIAGNHEYYRKALPEMDEILREAAQDTNIHFLENEAVVLGGTRFLGCVLWTNFTLFGETGWERGMWAAKQAMNDYALIRVSPSYKRLTPRRTAHLHAQSRRWLEQQLSQPFPGRTVVVTHHAPSLQSIQPQYRNDMVSTAFGENLDDFILAHSVDLWIHGHTHHCVDYHIGATRILSNQRGYAGNEAPDFLPDLVVEV